jgi:hypothetical protein
MGGDWQMFGAKGAARYSGDVGVLALQRTGDGSKNTSYELEV